MNFGSFLLCVSRTILSIGIFVCAAVTPIVAQAGNTPGAPTAGVGDAVIRSDVAFDVVSIRSSKAGSDQWHLQVIPGGDRYEAIGMPLGTTILMAYLPYRIGSKDRIVGAPAWVWNDEYDFIGTVGDADLPAWRKLNQNGFMAGNPMLQTMLQNALADRCNMIVHRVPALVAGYALVVSNHGTKRKNLIVSEPGDVIPDQTVKLDVNSRVVPIYSPDKPVLHFYQTSMAALARFMSGQVPIEDRTGLSGIYRFDLTRLGTDGNPSSDWDLAPLGLKLIPAKIPTETIMIDHIERPSPN